MESPVMLPVKSREKADVLVAGGGVSGCCAAIAAARMGKKAVLIDECGVPGGQGTLGFVAPISALNDRNGEAFGGLGQEITDRMQSVNSPNMLALTLVQMLHDAGVRVHYFTRILCTEREGRLIRSVVAAEKSGLKRFEADEFIDATGDADLAFFAGEETVTGSEEGVFDSLIREGLARMHKEHAAWSVPAPGALQPCSVMFTVGGVEESGRDLYKTYANHRFTYAELGITKEEFFRLPYAGKTGFEENGDFLPLPQGRFLFYRNGNRPGEYIVNMTRVLGVNGTDADSLNQGTSDALMQVLSILDLLRRLIPEFRNAYLIQASMRLGIRESRRILARRTFTGSEAISCALMPDVIAHGSYIIDIHDPKGKSMAIGGNIQGCAYDIPYACLLPKNTDNLWACGRCIGADHVAHASTRIMGTCMQTGQAAGTAAALCHTARCFNGELDVHALQAQLIRDGLRLKLDPVSHVFRGGESDI